MTHRSIRHRIITDGRRVAETLLTDEWDEVIVIRLNDGMMELGTTKMDSLRAVGILEWAKNVAQNTELDIEEPQ